MDQKVIIDLLVSIIKPLAAQQPPNRVTIADGAAYSNPSGFILYVGVAGDVQYTDLKGNTGTHNFVVGYHPTPITAVGNAGAGTTATDLAACF